MDLFTAFRYNYLKSILSHPFRDFLKKSQKSKESRAEKKLFQTHLPEIIGVSRNTISFIETWQFNPTAKLALILCIALDKKFEELFCF